jgi:hypothetical protein
VGPVCNANHYLKLSGTVKFEDMIVGSTVAEEVDAVTGLTHKVVIEAKVKKIF